MPPFTYAQKVAIATCPKITAALSLIGSSAILVNVAQRYPQQRRGHNNVHVSPSSSRTRRGQVVATRRRNSNSVHEKGILLTTRHRLLAGLSLLDVGASFGFFLTTWPIPKTGNPRVVWNVGNGHV
jgi:hypothetical protein